MSGRCQKTAKSNNRQIIIEHMFVYKRTLFHRPYYTTEMQYLSIYFCVIYWFFLVWQSEMQDKTMNPLYTATFWTQLCLKKRLGRSCDIRYVLITCEQFAETWRYSFPIKVCVAIKLPTPKTSCVCVRIFWEYLCFAKWRNIWILRLANDYKNTYSGKSFSWK